MPAYGLAPAMRLLVFRVPEPKMVHLQQHAQLHAWVDQLMGCAELQIRDLV